MDDRRIVAWCSARSGAYRPSWCVDPPFSTSLETQLRLRHGSCAAGFAVLLGGERDESPDGDESKEYGAPPCG